MLLYNDEIAHVLARTENVAARNLERAMNIMRRREKTSPSVPETGAAMVAATRYAMLTPGWIGCDREGQGVVGNLFVQVTSNATSMGRREIAMRRIEAKTAAFDAPSDMDLVSRALARDGEAFRMIMQRHNQRLYRLARGVVRDDFEAEDVVQEAYVQAFSHLGSFRGESSLSTWLSRITINEALGRLRSKRRAQNASVTLVNTAAAEIIRFPGSPDVEDPERAMAQRQILRLVEQATDHLPETFRSVFVARVIEGMSIEETAELLGLRPETVKTRLHRARALMRKELHAKIGPILLDAFPFAGRRCDRLTSAVMQRLGFIS